MQTQLSLNWGVPLDLRDHLLVWFPRLVAYLKVVCEVELLLEAS